MKRDAHDGLAMLPWYASDWLASNAHAEMPLEAQGAYRNLIDRMWLSGTCSLPDDDTRLRTLAGASIAEWKRVVDAVRMRLEPAGPGWLTNARLRHEWRKATNLRRVKREMARKAANSRWDQNLGRESRPSGPDAVRMRTECPPSPSPSPSQRTNGTPPTPRRAGGASRNGRETRAAQVEQLVALWLQLAATGDGQLQDQPPLDARDKVRAALRSGQTYARVAASITEQVRAALEAVGLMAEPRNEASA